MKDEILSYWDMCARERGSLQRGMYFRPSPSVSIVLMSRRPSALYEDSLSVDGTILEYEGHDAKRGQDSDPKTIDQPWDLPSGLPTENAKFAQAASSLSSQRQLVRAYEKLKDGIWSDKGLFELVSYTYDIKPAEGRRVFKFQMKLSSIDDDSASAQLDEPSRLIPSWVKQAVYKRDKGQCVLCGAQDQLHFDHELPFSRGGASVLPENVRILCARHNLSKGARIE
jgi:hypothetical protein